MEKRRTALSEGTDNESNDTCEYENENLSYPILIVKIVTLHLRL